MARRTARSPPAVGQSLVTIAVLLSGCGSANRTQEATDCQGAYGLYTAGCVQGGCAAICNLQPGERVYCYDSAGNKVGSFTVGFCEKCSECYPQWQATEAAYWAGVSERTLPRGARCLHDKQCQRGLACEGNGAQPVCAPDETLLGPSCGTSRCASGQVCLGTACCPASCADSDAATMDGCTADGTCYHFDPVARAGLPPCTVCTDTAQCPDLHSCIHMGGEDGACLSGCAQNSDCGQGFVCAETCFPSSFSCADVRAKCTPTDPSFLFQCADGDLYRYDDCGVRELFEDCADGCSDGRCVP